MRALLLALVASVAWAQSTPAPRFKRFTTRTEQGRNTRGLLAESLAFFEFFPASGAGLTSACSATAPTGAKGETLTFSRTGAAYCSKRGMALTGIQPGDLVSMLSNVARIEPDFQGVLGLRVESSRVQWLARSEEFENAAWVKANFATSALPVVTANAGTAPDGARTADRIWYDACPDDPGQSVVYQQTASSAARSVHSVYIRGCIPLSDAGCVDETLTDSGDGGVQFADGGAARGPDGGVGRGTMSLCMYNGAADPTNNTCVQCNYNALSWMRCENNFGGSGTSPYTMLGCIRSTSTYSNSVNVGVGEVLVWGAQQEGVTASPSYSTSYAGTAGGSGVTRNAEAATVNGNTLGLPTARYSLAASIQTLAPGAVTRGIVEGQVGVTSGVGFFTVSGFLRTQNLTAGVDNTTDFAWTPNVNQLYRLATFNDGANQSTIIDGTTVIGPVARTPPDSPWSATTGIGYAPAFPAQLDGIISRVCIDPSATRCR